MKISIYKIGLLPLLITFLLVASFAFTRPAYSENVIFIVPGASSPSSTLQFDPPSQIIDKGQSITFVNVDSINHQLVVKDAKGQQVFDTGLLEKTDSKSYTFPENGMYSIQDTTFAHVKGKVIVTDDILTITKTIQSEKIDVQLSRSPAFPKVNQEMYYTITFINKENGRNHSHIDFTLNFNDTSGKYIDGAGGHTVDGQEFAKFKFDKVGTFTPTVTISGVDLHPINPESVTFDAVVIPEFPALALWMTIAGVLAAVALYTRYNQRGHDLHG
jgi:plastocyanin